MPKSLYVNAKVEVHRDMDPVGKYVSGSVKYKNDNLSIEAKVKYCAPYKAPTLDINF